MAYLKFLVVQHFVVNLKILINWYTFEMPHYMSYKRKSRLCSLSHYPNLVQGLPLKNLHFEYKRRWLKNLNSSNCLREWVKSIFSLIILNLLLPFLLTKHINTDANKVRPLPCKSAVNMYQGEKQWTRRTAVHKGCAFLLFARRIFMAFIAGSKEHLKI